LGSAKPVGIGIGPRETRQGRSWGIPDPAAVNAIAWTEWKIPLIRFIGVNLSRIRTLCLGVGDRKNPAQGGSGRIYIDDILASKPWVCIRGCRTRCSLEADVF